MSGDARVRFDPGPPVARAGESLDRLTPGWKIFQLERGHRFSTDDLVTAWRATLAVPAASRILDLGCGIGAVGLSALWRLAPEATMIGLEAQEVSADLARRTVSLNGLESRVKVLDGDLRNPAALPAGATFPLVTGSPPYLPLGTGKLSPFDQ